jgi:dTDP-4-amino-4,6-dideoxygalactose transaminase
MLAAAGVGPGDEVVVPALTFAATANVVEHVGARVVFADVDAVTLNITAQTIERKLSPRTKAVIVVHYAGLACDMMAIGELCTAKKLVLLEDAAHAVGTRHRGANIGTHTEGVAFSFYANKNMTTGEGGMLTTSNEELANRLRVMRLHGMSRDAWKRYTAVGAWRYDIIEAGYKYNMSDLNAAIGLVQMRKLEGFIERRGVIARRYRDGLADLPVVLQSEAPAGDRHAYHLLVLRVSGARSAVPRDMLMGALAENEIGYSVHFIPLHMMSHFRAQCPDAGRELPVCDRLADELISLPMHPGLSDGDVDRVIGVIRGVFGRG